MPADDTKAVSPKDQPAFAAKAMKLKTDGAQPADHPDSGRQSNEGMAPLPDIDRAPSGAFDAEGERPVLERSRKVR